MTRRTLFGTSLMALPAYGLSKDPLIEAKVEHDQDTVIEVYLGKFWPDDFMYSMDENSPVFHKKIKFARRKLMYPGPHLEKTWCPGCGALMNSRLGAIEYLFDVPVDSDGVTYVWSILKSKHSPGSAVDEFWNNPRSIVNKVRLHCDLVTPIYMVRPNPATRCCECRKA